MSNEQETIDDILLNDPEMVAAFVAEANEHLDSIEDDFLTLERQQSNPDRALLDKVFRAIHSVKGAAGFLNLSRMAELAHIMEALLTKMRAGKILPDSDNIDSLLAGVDLLKTMLMNIKESNEVDIRLVHEQLASLTEQSSVAPAPPPQEKTPQPSGQEKTPAPPAEKSESDPGNTVRIHVDILDKLMVQAGELVLIRNQQLLNVDESDPVSRSIAHRLDLITSELQQTIISTRMQPVGKVIDKFPRIVRDMGKSLGKQIDIEIMGSSAELDKTILESLTDPLTHIIRNCCGHGIETPEERVRAGKPKTGLITIAAFHEAGRVNIRIGDDGRGVDTERIRKKVVEKGLKTEAELEQMTHQEVLNLVFLPGFSTMDKADDVSGRGVGMDVVKTGIEKIGGSFEFESRTGEGTTILLQLPLTLAIIPSLIVSANGHLFAIPQVSLVELVTLYDDDVRLKIERADDQEVYRLRGRLLPIVRLSEVLERPQLFNRDTRSEIAEKYARLPLPAPQSGLSPPDGVSDDEPSDSLSFVVLKVGNSLYGLVVDDIIGTEEIVVKPLHAPIRALGIYSGATIMGSGKTALILDVGGIARHTGITLAERIMEEREKEFRTEDQQTVLLFKSGPREQLALSLPLIRRIEPILAKDIELIGDREYIAVDGTSTQVLRLDRFLQVSPVEDRENMFLILPRHLKRPVGILMTAFVDVIETGIALDVNSYRADGLLGTAIINKSMTLFLDIYRLVEKIDPEYREMRASGIPDEAADGRGADRILLLEDIAFFRQLIKGYLKEKGYEVVDCKNGKIGLEQLEENDFDLIISDLEMPVMNGWQFIKSVRQSMRKKDIPAVALTSLDTEEARQRTLESGFDYFEIKLDREHFLRTVSAALQKNP
jgi:two-component system, chemotaxis family, sensor kinase CheA